MSSENYVFACDGKTFNLIRSKVNAPLTQYRFPNLMFELWKNNWSSLFHITIFHQYVQDSENKDI